MLLSHLNKKYFAKDAIQVTDNKGLDFRMHLHVKRFCVWGVEFSVM